MDPLSSLSVASSAIQIVDFSAKLWSQIREVYESESGSLAAHENIREDAKRLRGLNSGLSDLLTPENLRRNLNSTEKDIVLLCADCDLAAGQLVEAVNRLSLKDDKNEASDAEPSCHGPYFDNADQRTTAFVGNKRKRFTNRKWDAVRVAMREVWMRKDINKLHQRVENLKQSLAATILVNIQQDIIGSNKKLSRLCEPEKWNGARSIDEWFDSNNLNAHICRRNLMQALERSNAYLDVDDLCENLKIRAWHKSPLSKNLVSSILEKLDYKTMFNRDERISENFAQTFQWIYSEPRDQTKPWNSFANWLTSTKESVYWITGKAGSGKSTLMKMLFYDLRTKQFLSQWSRRVPLVTASFFFWNSGPKLLMSREGLLRSILFQALPQRLRLESEKLQKKLEAVTLSVDLSQELHWKDLLQLFRFLIEDEDLPVNYAFFLDGLDEFEGDKSELITLVHTLGAFSNVKICISSRPWIVFEDAFKQQPSLMLQYLTFDDIALYVRENLTRHSAFHELAWGQSTYASDLVHKITSKASGVFLWVVLAVRSLLEGLGDGDRIPDLEARLEEIPEELEELFNKILHGLKGRYFNDAARLFRIYGAVKSPLDLLTLSFADEDTYKTLLRRPIATLSAKERFTRATTMKRRLNSRCKGLLEIGRSNALVWNTRDLKRLISESRSGDPGALSQLDDYGRAVAESHIQYLHRSVKDYLKTPAVQEAMDRASGDLNPSACLSIAQLLRLKTMHVGATNDRLVFLENLRYFFESAATLSLSDKTLYVELVDIANQVATDIATLPTANTETMIQKIWPSSNRHWASITNGGKESDDFLAFAVRYNFLCYLESKFELSTPSEADCSRLLHTAVSVEINKDIPAPEIDLLRLQNSGQGKPELAMVFLLLRYGANPSLSVDGKTSLQIVKDRKTMKSPRFEGLVPILETIEVMFNDRLKKRGYGSRLNLAARKFRK